MAFNFGYPHGSSPMGMSHPLPSPSSSSAKLPQNSSTSTYSSRAGDVGSGSGGTGAGVFSTSKPTVPLSAGQVDRTTYDPSSMITRSRTLYFLSIRDTLGFGVGSGGGGSAGAGGSRKRGKRRKFNAQNGPAGNALGDEEQSVGLLDAHDEGGRRSFDQDLPPKWVDAVDEVEDILSGTSKKIEALEKLHSKHVLPGFADRSAEERDIERRTAEITRDLRRSHTLISSIRPDTRDPNESVAARNVQRALAAKAQDISAIFRKKQRVYMEQLQGHAIKNKDLLVASGAVTLRGPELFDELEEDLQAVMASPANAASATIAQRDREITQIAQSIGELADLFRDLGNLVVEQGSVLDCVEYNVQQTANHMVEAEKELKVATRYQRNTGRRKCIFFLLLVILALILILIYKPRGRPDAVGRPPDGHDAVVVDDEIIERPKHPPGSSDNDQPAESSPPPRPSRHPRPPPRPSSSRIQIRPPSRPPIQTRSPLREQPKRIARVKTGLQEDNDPAHSATMDMLE